MKKLLILTLILISLNTYAQSSKVFDAETMHSEILNMDRKYAVYLPPSYETSQRSYPVLYLLHGGGDDQTGWVQFGEVQRIADKAFDDMIATEMIIIMPDADTGKRGYFNSPDNSWRYEDFFFEELMPYVENKYRIKKDKRYRAVAGLSMGGGGSYFYAMRHPELFSSACPLSASVRNYDKETLKSWLDRTNTTYTDAQLDAYLEKQSSLRMLENADLDAIKKVKWYFSCGDDDFLYEGNSLVHIAFRQKEIAHEFRIQDGAHNWTYWRTELPNVLEFVSDTFHQK